jgi:hypothetical protein
MIPTRHLGKTERSGIRDLKFNKWRRQYGLNMYAFDNDLTLYDDSARPICRFEEKSPYKLEPIDVGSFQMECLRHDANDRYPLFAIICYFMDKSNHVLRSDELREAPIEDMKLFVSNLMYFLVPANKKARNYISLPKMLSERDFVMMEYTIRNKPCPQDLLDGCFDKLSVVPSVLEPEVKPHSFLFSL